VPRAYGPCALLYDRAKGCCRCCGDADAYFIGGHDGNPSSIVEKVALVTAECLDEWRANDRSDTGSDWGRVSALPEHDRPAQLTWNQSLVDS